MEIYTTQLRTERFFFRHGSPKHTLTTTRRCQLQCSGVAHRACEVVGVANWLEVLLGSQEETHGTCQLFVGVSSARSMSRNPSSRGCCCCVAQRPQPICPSAFPRTRSFSFRCQPRHERSAMSVTVGGSPPQAPQRRRHSALALVGGLDLSNACRTRTPTCPILRDRLAMIRVRPTVADENVTAPFCVKRLPLVCRASSGTACPRVLRRCGRLAHAVAADPRHVELPRRPLVCRLLAHRPRTSPVLVLKCSVCSCCAGSDRSTRARERDGAIF